MSKKYVGQRPLDEDLGDCKVFVVEGDQVQPLRHIDYHSDGLEWGYGGSGPADTALSILADYFGEKPSQEELRRGDCKCWYHHQAFKRDFIAGADHAGFTITTEEITAWVEKRQR